MGGDTQSTTKGIAAMAAAMFFLPIMDAIGKWLSIVDNVPPATVTFGRFFFQSLITLAIILALRGMGALKTRNLNGNLIRGSLMGIGGVCFFVAIKYMPLADALAIFFVEPLILTLLSAVILKEQVGWRRLSAVAVGFLGTLLVIQPSWEVFGWVSLLPLVTATFFAIYLILNRVYSADDSPLVMQLYAGLGGSLITGAILIAGSLLQIDDLSAGMPSGSLPWALLVSIGAIATVGHLLVVHASRLIPASLLAPFQYLEIVMAVLIGLVVFAEFPSLTKWIGILIIVGSGVYVFWRERVGAQKAALATMQP
ncbi:MAG: DMT family transporter [Phyllobacterium sp.]